MKTVIVVVLIFLWFFGLIGFGIWNAQEKYDRIVTCPTESIGYRDVTVELDGSCHVTYYKLDSLKKRLIAEAIYVSIFSCVCAIAGYAVVRGDKE